MNTIIKRHDGPSSFCTAQIVASCNRLDSIGYLLSFVVERWDRIRSEEKEVRKSVVVFFWDRQFGSC